jgi:hypothetical protein
VTALAMVKRFGRYTTPAMSIIENKTKSEWH